MTATWPEQTLRFIIGSPTMSVEGPERAGSSAAGGGEAAVMDHMVVAAADRSVPAPGTEPDGARWLVGIDINQREETIRDGEPLVFIHSYESAGFCSTSDHHLRPGGTASQQLPPLASR